MLGVVKPKTRFRPRFEDLFRYYLRRYSLPPRVATTGGPPSSGINLDLLAELKSRPINNFFVFELDLEPSVTRRYSEAWAAASAGLYEGRVIEAGDITREVSDSGFNLPDDQASVTIHDDKDRTLEKILMGSAVGDISGSACRIKLVSKTLPASKWFTVFSGIVRSFSMPSLRMWQFELARDSRPLEGLVKIPTFQDYDWANLPKGSRGVAANVVYGRHSSAGTAVTGMVPCTYVDDVLFQYVPTFGLAASIGDVYSDGTLKTLATDYTVDLTFFKNGKYWTVIDFVDDQLDGDITCDMDGMTDGGVITNPATQLEHLLTNFVFGDWANSTDISNSAWLQAADFQIHEGFFSEVKQFLADKQIDKGSRVIEGDRKGRDILDEWCNEFRIPSFWTYDGKIAIRADDHTRVNTYISAPHLRQDISPEPETISVMFDAERLVDEVMVDYIYSHADGDFQKSLTVKDLSKGYDSAEALKLHWRESVT